MRPLIFDYLFHDDRMFVLEISTTTSSNSASGTQMKQEWALVTRRNVPGYPPHRVDTFPTREEAIEYYKEVAVEVPRVSLGNMPLNPPPSIEEFTAWLTVEKLFDPILNPDAPRKSDT